MRRVRICSSTYEATTSHRPSYVLVAQEKSDQGQGKDCDVVFPPRKPDGALFFASWISAPPPTVSSTRNSTRLRSTYSEQHNFFWIGTAMDPRTPLPGYKLAALRTGESGRCDGRGHYWLRSRLISPPEGTSVINHKCKHHPA